jgi:cytochrome P450
MNTNEASWRKRRQLMNPAFHRKCLKDFMGNFNNVCDMFMTRLDIELLMLVSQPVCCRNLQKSLWKL